MQPEPKPRKDETRTVPVLDRSEVEQQAPMDSVEVCAEEAAELERVLESLRESSGAGVALTQRLKNQASTLSSDCNIMRTSMSLMNEEQELGGERRNETGKPRRRH